MCNYVVCCVITYVCDYIIRSYIACDYIISVSSCVCIYSVHDRNVFVNTCVCDCMTCDYIVCDWIVGMISFLRNYAVCCNYNKWN
jgi:hypothetical protein